MKNLKTSFANRVRLYRGALIAILFAVPVVQSEAQIYTINSTNAGVIYSMIFNTGSSGLTGLQVDGVNQLNLQTLYYSINGGTVSQLTGPTATVTPGHVPKITATYTVSGVISAVDTIALNGNTLGESINVENLSANTLTLSLFQYSDFVLGNAPGSQTLNMTVLNSTQSTAAQGGGGLTLDWSGQLTSGTVEVQADGSGTQFGPFNGSATALNNSPLSALGNVDFGYEFDAVNVAPGNSFTVSEVSTLPVPEPSSMMLISAGMLALGLMSRRRKS
jgi:hypothetical protein